MQWRWGRILLWHVAQYKAPSHPRSTLSFHSIPVKLFFVYRVGQCIWSVDSMKFNGEAVVGTYREIEIIIKVPTERHPHCVGRWIKNSPLSLISSAWWMAKEDILCKTMAGRFSCWTLTGASSSLLGWLPTHVSMLHFTPLILPFAKQAPNSAMNTGQSSWDYIKTPIQLLC